MFGVNAFACVRNEDTVCCTGGATTRSVTRFPSPGDNESVELAGFDGDPSAAPVENAGSGILATVM